MKSIKRRVRTIRQGLQRVKEVKELQHPSFWSIRAAGERFETN